MLRKPLILLFLALPPAAFSAWTTSILLPAGAVSSSATAVYGSMIVGGASYGAGGKGHIWALDGSSTILETSESSSEATATDGVHAYGSQNTKAGSWNASGVWTSLVPSGGTFSQIYGASVGQQVGWARFSGVRRASLWRGSSASWTDLHPLGRIESLAWATDGAQQVGTTTTSFEQAALWSGTSSSFVNLHPTGASISGAFAVQNGIQYGYATFSGIARAGRWSGSAQSWQPMHPLGADLSAILAASGNLQVGMASINGRLSPVLWRGDANSYENLMPTLPSAYSDAQASGVWTDGVTIRIVGRALHAPTGQNHAVLWTAVVPEPNSALACIVGLALLRSRKSLGGS